MARSIYDNFISQSSSGVTVPGATVRVNKTGAGTPLADIYNLREGGSTISNPATAGTDGRVTFYIDPGRYTFTVMEGANTVVYPDVLVSPEDYLVSVPLATTSASGLMSGADKSKLDSLSVSSAAFSEPGSENIKFIAHRGLSNAAPENTMPAYDLAGNAGFWGAECDVQLTSDDEWVLMHDSTVDRTTNGTGNISSLTLAQVKALDAGTWKNSYYTGARVPTVLEYLKACRRGRVVPVVEIKNGPYTQVQIDDLVEKVLSVFPDYSCVIMSFGLDNITQVRASDSKIHIKYLTSYSTANVDVCAGLGNCGIVLNSSDVPTDQSYARDSGVSVFAYTINDSDLAYELIDKGVSGIITDFIRRVR